jgi:phytoene dehydrogenase-like protein
MVTSTPLWRQKSWDAIVVGAGPNGLAAAVTLARAGHSVLVLEAQETIGGGVRSAALTSPGFIHDICSSVYPLAVVSPVFAGMPLAAHGLEWIYPPLALAHPFDDGTAAVLERSITATALALGSDGKAYVRLFGPLITRWQQLQGDLLGPPTRIPRHPTIFARFAFRALRSASRLATSLFAESTTRALFAGLAAHSMLPLERPATAAIAMVLGITGHTAGWPIARGGAQNIAHALASYFHSLGGEIVSGVQVDSIDTLPPARAILCDVTPRQLLQIAGHRLPRFYRRRLQRYRYGVGAYKVDWALAAPIPWAAVACTRAGTVHLGGTLEEICLAEQAPWQNRVAPQPFVLLTQPTLFDSTRAPQGRHTAWAYCHVPHGSSTVMVDQIEAQVERFAPGFRARIMARSTLSPLDLEGHNANLIGGDINGGVQDLWQLFFRPSLRHYTTPLKGLYLCSASTPPGGGVHGMCGYHAATAALREVFG